MTKVEIWLEKISNLHPKTMDLSLERVTHIASELELTHFSFPVITVTGTNGKGSTVKLLTSILTAAGYRVGSYTSPHLFVFNERIMINGCMINDEALCAAFEKIEQTRQSMTLTYFEFTTLAALWLFKQTNLQVLLLEVGLGGRLDAVNVVANDLAIITSVALDHTEWLGDDREAIGYEKAGIFKPGKLAICGDHDMPLSVKTQAEKNQTTLYCYNEDHSPQSYYYSVHNQNWDWHGPTSQFFALPLPNLLIQNAATVMMAVELLSKQLDISPRAIETGLLQANLPGRQQIIAQQPTVILDVAHNPAAMRVLANYLKTQPCTGKTSIVIGMLADKDIHNSLAELHPCIDQWYLATLACTPRGAHSEQLAQVLNNLQVPKEDYQQFADPCLAFSAAKGGSVDQDRIIVCGSFYTVTEVSSFFNRP